MKILDDFQKLPWCQVEWSHPNLSKESSELLKQCLDLTIHAETGPPEEELIRKSKAFPIPFPIQTVRVEYLKTLKPIEKLRRNILSTYPLIHEKVLLLMADFLSYKRQFGTSIEKALYENMTVCDLIDRILKKRAVTFLGNNDYYRLITDEEGKGGWEEIGTSKEKPPLVLENCLSYDEMKLSAMVFVSGYTQCMNDGKRTNNGFVNEEIAEEEAIIIGLVGPRFQRTGKIDYEDILITPEQNTPENGYADPTPRFYDFMTSRNGHLAKRMWRKLWADFYQIDNTLYDRVAPSMNKEHDQKPYMEKYFHIQRKKYGDPIFDNEAYYRRIVILAECTLLEAEHRAERCSKNAFINVIGCGLGSWLLSEHQPDLYVLLFLERARRLLARGALGHVTDLNFAYIQVSAEIEEIFTEFEEKNDQSPERRWVFIPNDRHPHGGIKVQMQNREPSSKLLGEHAGKLLVMTYPWNGNSLPGNDFWYGSLHLYSSGDPAAACSTQVAELHNAHINGAVSASNARVAGRGAVRALSNCCRALVEDARPEHDSDE